MISCPPFISFILLYVKLSTIRLEDSDVEDVSTLGDPVYGSDPIMFVAPVDHQDSTTERRFV